LLGGDRRELERALRRGHVRGAHVHDDDTLEWLHPSYWTAAPIDWGVSPPTLAHRLGISFAEGPQEPDELEQWSVVVSSDDVIAYRARLELAAAPTAEPAPVPPMIEPPRNKGGRPQVYDWTSAEDGVCRRVYHNDGISESDVTSINAVAGFLERWFLDAGIKPPSDTELKEHARPLYARLKAMIGE
jgi:hypothetical protein